MVSSLRHQTKNPPPPIISGADCPKCGCWSSIIHVPYLNCCPGFELYRKVIQDYSGGLELHRGLSFQSDRNTISIEFGRSDA
jgi:hypothetical protein